MDRYQIESKLGSGGTAVVYKAVDTVLNREVTVKILQEQFTTNQKFVMRFRKEAQAVAALSHPNIVSVYDVGCSENNEHYLIMEYIEGHTLKEIIQKKAPLSLDRSLDYIHQILAGLNHAHSYGVIHRDIKPQNIMITNDGQVKIMDFGLAMNLTDTTITYDTSIFGSVYYIAPEIAQKGSGDERVDLYSTGIVLYEMLTGKLPFTGDSPISIALQHVDGKYVPIDEIDDDIPYEVARIVDKAMSVNPRTRYANAGIMMSDIEIAADEYDVELSPIQMTTSVKATKVRTRKISRDTEEEAPRYERKRAEKQKVSPRKKRAEYDDDDDEDEKKGSKKFVVAIVIAVIALLALCVGGFAIIRNVTNGGEKVIVPQVVGLSQEDAISTLAGMNLEYKIIEGSSDEYGEGIVIAQDIAAGTEVKAGKEIKITINLSKNGIEVPDVTGKSKDAAVMALENAGFEVNIEEEASETVEKDKVISQSPSKGRKLKEGSKVTIVVSTGAANVSVPNVVGLTKDDAISRLHDLKLRYSITSYEYNNSYAEGYVIYQNYNAGEEIAPDSVVNIKISKGPKPEEKPEDNPGGGESHNSDNPADSGEIVE